MTPDEQAPREHLPHACGVYIMRDSAGEVLYVGKANDLAKRVAHYFNPSKADLKSELLAPLARKIDYVHCASEREALLWERRLIQRHQPFFNVMWKDDKSYPYVKITLGEDFPRFVVTRKKLRDGGLYFGPYPKVTPIRGLLRAFWKRKLFPLRPCDYDFSMKKPLAERKIKSCLYYHTGECPAPCAGRVSREDYRRIAKDAALFFRGRYDELKGRFETGMRAASEALEFERAAQLRDNLTAIEHMAERVRYEEVKPEKMLERLGASRAVTDLQAALGLPRPPHHIECFDISHLFGRETVGSMVCFQGGEPHRGHYRRFKIRTVGRRIAPDASPEGREHERAPARSIDDFASMREVLGRRYKSLQEAGSPLPDLVLIDGGKGQLSAAQEALEELKLRLSLAALAKREEEVFLPGRPDSIRLDRARPGLRLLQRLRDEAHRFAVTYHRLLRKKELIPDEPA